MKMGGEGQCVSNKRSICRSPRAQDEARKSKKTRAKSGLIDMSPLSGRPRSIDRGCFLGHHIWVGESNNLVPDLWAAKQMTIG